MHTWKTVILIAVTALIALPIAACKEKSSNVDDIGRANAPAQSAPTSSASSRKADDITPASTGKVHSGVIIETTDVKDYTYIHFKDREGLTHWAAVVRGRFESGKDIAIEESIVMKDFTSPTLNKTFESIIFGNVVGKKAANDTAPASQTQLPPGHPNIEKADSATSPELPEGHPPIN